MLTSHWRDCETNPTTCNLPVIASQTSIGVHPKGDLSLDDKEKEIVRRVQL
jgi:hypothetical protein